MVPARGRLVDYLDQDLPEVKHLLQYGYCVIKGAVSYEEVQELNSGIWDEFEALGTGVDRNDPSTHKTDNFPMSSHGLVQHAGFGLTPGVCKARLATEAAWKRLFKGSELISSFDGISFCSTAYSDRQAHVTKSTGIPVYSNKAVPGVAAWLHTDQQNAKTEAFHCIQGALALTQLGMAEVSTQLIAPRPGQSAQGLRDEFLKAFPGDPDDKAHKTAERAAWRPHSDDEVAWLADVADVLKPVLEPGDLLLWCSGMPHASAPGELPDGQLNRRDRLSVFVSCLPLDLVSDEELEARRVALERKLTSGHRVVEMGKRGFRQCLFDYARRSYGGIPPPKFNMSRVLSEFDQPSDDAIHRGMARFCGGYGLRTIAEATAPAPAPAPAPKPEPAAKRLKTMPKVAATLYAPDSENDGLVC